MIQITKRDLQRDAAFIGGDWVGTAIDPVCDPASGAQIGRVPNLGEAEALKAVEAASLAFPAWSALTAKARSVILRRWYQLMIANREDLARIMTSEQGKPLDEARGEVDYAASFVEFYAEEARRVGGEVIPSHRKDARILVLRQPVGVVAAITPWNFPAAMVTRKVAPALAVGCTAVLKPAPETPLTALALAKLAEEAGIPAGVFNVVTGDAVAIGRVFTTHPEVRAISFTGSTAVGKLLMSQAASTVKKVGLELGGNAPFIVFDDADLDAAVEGAMISKFRNMGQTCVCPNRLYVHDAIHDAFVDRLVRRVGALRVGNGAQDGISIGPLIKPAAVNKVEAHVADALSRGAKLVVGGARHELGGTFFQPTVLTGVDASMLITREETFGPVAPIYRFRDEAEVVRQANDTPYGLAAYFYARDLGRVMRVAEALQVGMVGVNTAALGVDSAPFGGVKESGLGREGSSHGVDEYVELKYVLLGGV